MFIHVFVIWLSSSLCRLAACACEFLSWKNFIRRKHAFNEQCSHISCYLLALFFHGTPNDSPVGLFLENFWKWRDSCQDYWSGLIYGLTALGPDLIKNLNLPWICITLLCSTISFLLDESGLVSVTCANYKKLSYVTLHFNFSQEITSGTLFTGLAFSIHLSVFLIKIKPSVAQPLPITWS